MSEPILWEAQIELFRRELDKFEQYIDAREKVIRSLNILNTRKRETREILIQLSKNESKIEDFKAKNPDIIPQFIHNCELESRYLRLLEYAISEHESKLEMFMKKFRVAFANVNQSSDIDDCIKSLFRGIRNILRIKKERNERVKMLAQEMLGSFTFWKRMNRSSIPLENIAKIIEEEIENDKKAVAGRSIIKENIAKLIQLCKNVTFVSSDVNKERLIGVHYLIDRIADGAIGVKVPAKKRIYRTGESDDDIVDEMIAVGFSWI